VAEILAGSAGSLDYPSKLVRPEDGELVWLLETAAASAWHSTG
jgi:hypothetical protein